MNPMNYKTYPEQLREILKNLDEDLVYCKERIESYKEYIENHKNNIEKIIKDKQQFQKVLDIIESKGYSEGCECTLEDLILGGCTCGRREKKCQ